MAGCSSRKELVVEYKKETILNAKALNRVHPMSYELSGILKDNALDKPSQTLFYQLSYYFLGIIDSQAARCLPWPLYDTAMERTFKNNLSSIISDYSSKGLLSPVLPSFLVHPGCYKVTVLLSELSQLAMQKTLLSKMRKESQIKLYNEVTEIYKSGDKQKFKEIIEKATTTTVSSTKLLISNYLYKREKIEKIAAIMRKRITEMESKLSTLKAQEYINGLVDGYLKTHKVDEITKIEMLNIKKVNEPAKYFDVWLSDLDEKLSKMENKYDERMKPFLELAIKTQKSSEMLVLREMGVADKNDYMLEFNPKTDNICIKELLSEVNVEQQYILKNIVRNGQLSFPNLIRGFVIAVSYVLKNTDNSENLVEFNERLDDYVKQSAEHASSMKKLIERVQKAEAKLKPRNIAELHYVPQEHEAPYFYIPPLPDFSGLKFANLSPTICDTFTPLKIPKLQFNLRRGKKAIHLPSTSEPPVRKTIKKSSSSNAAPNNFADANILNNNNDTLKAETPANHTRLIPRTSSLEKIITRFNKVKANVLASEMQASTLVEEEHTEENMVNIESSTANRVLLPELSSPSNNTLQSGTVLFDDDDDENVTSKPRVSLGTLLGVDYTFLDQFDLVD